MRVAVVGAGIAGMTAAAALHQRGCDVEVFEQASALGEVGAGLQVAPNAGKVLRALGLEHEMQALFFEPTDSVSLEWNTGALRHRETLKGRAAETFGAPYRMGHRADLHAMLCALLPAERIHLGRRCTESESRADGATLRFADGGTVDADVVIASDGIHSGLRDAWFGKGSPRFTHQVCWRAIVTIDRVPHRVGPDGSVVLEGSEYFRWIGPRGHVICYPIRAGRLLNIFAGYVSDEWADESWSVPSSRAEMLEAYAGWDPAMLEMFGGITDCYKWGIYDRDPLPAWRHERIVLIGDAAHPMMPTLAQGAAISMEDGYGIALALTAHAEPDLALARFEAERRPRATRVQLQARAQFENNRRVPAPPPIATDWIYGYDPATLA